MGHATRVGNQARARRDRETSLLGTTWLEPALVRAIHALEECGACTSPFAGERQRPLSEGWIASRSAGAAEWLRALRSVAARKSVGLPERARSARRALLV